MWHLWLRWHEIRVVEHFTGFGHVLTKKHREISKNPTQYRIVYRKATGGEFRSSQHLASYVENNYGGNEWLKAPATMSQCAEGEKA